MKWMSLKIYLLPLIMQEVDNVIEKYINLINELRRTNDSEIMSEFDDLRDSINKRIHELEAFYEENIHDLRITNFEKVRLRLKKLLMYDIETLNKIENTTSEVSRGLTFGYNKSENMSNPSSNRLEQSENPNVNTVKQKNSSNNTKNEIHKKNDYSKNPVEEKRINPKDDQSRNEEMGDVNNSFGEINKSKIQKSDLKKANVKFNPHVMENSYNKYTLNSVNTNNKKNETGMSNSPLTNTNTINKDKTNISNIDSFANTGISNIIGPDWKEMNKWKEIVFKIKLTEGEYKLLLKEKSRGVKI